MTKIKAVFTAALALTIIILFSSIPADAGWIQKHRDGETSLMSKGRVKGFSESDRGMWTIMDINKGVMTIVDGQRKLYSSGTVNEFCKGAEAMQEKMMANIPPEQRQMMEQMMKGNKAGNKPAVSIKKIGAGGKVAGMKTVKYNVMVDGALNREVWVAHDAPIFKEMKKYMGKIARLSSDMQSCMSGSFGHGQFDLDDSPEYMKLEESGLVVKEVADGQVTNEIISIEKKKIPESEFQVPAGYKKAPLADFMMGQLMMEQ